MIFVGSDRRHTKAKKFCEKENALEELILIVDYLVTARLASYPANKKWLHFWSHDRKEAKEGNQGRRCKTPLLAEERLSEMCRERSVKVKTAAASFITWE
jgi:hypothetical protein